MKNEDGFITSTRGERVAIRPQIAEWFVTRKDRERAEEEETPVPQKSPAQARSVCDLRLRAAKNGFDLFVTAGDSSPWHLVPVEDTVQLVNFGAMQRLVQMYANLRLSASPTFWVNVAAPVLLRGVAFGEGRFEGLRPAPRERAA